MPEGGRGITVCTNMNSESSSQLRFVVGDYTVLDSARCACGRTHLRLRRITGRNDDMLIIRGVNVYPSQIEAVLIGMHDLAPHYQLVVSRRGNMDELAVEVEAAPSLHASADAYRTLAEQVRYQIKSMIGVTTDVLVKKPGEVPRSQGKAVRVRGGRPKLE